MQYEWSTKVECLWLGRLNRIYSTEYGKTGLLWHSNYMRYSAPTFTAEENLYGAYLVRFGCARCGPITSIRLVANSHRDIFYRTTCDAPPLSTYTTRFDESF